MLKNFPEMVFLFDRRLLCRAYNDACLPLLKGSEGGGLAGLPINEIFSPDIGAQWISEICARNAEVLKTLQPCRFGGTIILAGKSLIHTSAAISPIQDEGGGCSGTVMVVSDVTELVETKLRAEEAAKAQSSFLANMSHEIRTPMNAVKGLSELLALTELSVLQRNYVKNIISSANSLLSIINDVLDFSKIDANKTEFIECSYNVAELITGVCNTVNLRASEKNLLLLVDASPDLPVTLSGDDVRIKQIITNILSNALKYTSKGHIRLKLRAEGIDAETVWLVCSVEDTGIGIRESDIPDLFNAFSRADLRTNRKVAGTGLGLAITKQLVTAMDGEISVESVFGKGTEFTFRIPQKIVDGRPLAKLEAPEKRRALLLESGGRADNLIDMLGALGVPCEHISSQAALENAQLTGFTHCIYDKNFSERIIRSLCERMPDCLFAGLKDIRYAMEISDYHDTILYLPVLITELASFLARNDTGARNPGDSSEGGGELALINTKALTVDDNDINLIVSGEILRSMGADVVCASSGEEAIQLCAEQKFDIIFMDHMMPGKDGIETALEIRGGKTSNNETPIVALTANVGSGMKEFYLRSGMDHFLGKPVDLDHIRRVLRRWLPKGKISSAERAAPETAARSGILSPSDLIAAFDNFGLYSSDVMREMNGDFDGYIERMEVASGILDGLVERLKSEVSQERWDDFSQDCVKLRALLYGIGARDCATRARKLAIAGRERNADYIYEDFFSLMGNMYMLGKKLAVIVPFARGGKENELPLNAPHFLYGCLDKMARALCENDAVEAMVQLENAAAFSLNMELDMALKRIKIDLEAGDFAAAAEHHAAIFQMYEKQMGYLP